MFQGNAFTAQHQRLLSAQVMRFILRNDTSCRKSEQASFVQDAIFPSHGNSIYLELGNYQEHPFAVMEDAMTTSFFITDPFHQTADLADVPRSLRDGSDSSPEKPRRHRSAITASIEWIRSSPTRALDWRWGFALDLVEDGRRGPRESVDPWLIEAVRYQRDASRKCLPETLAKRYPAVHAAQRLHLGEIAHRLLLETWILTGTDNDEVGRRVGISPVVVDAYEHLFFNVKDRLDATDFVIARLSHSHRTQLYPRAEVVQRQAYFCGPVVLEAMLEAIGGPLGFLGGPWPEADLSTPEGRRQVRIQLLLDVETLDLSEVGPRELLHLREICEQPRVEAAKEVSWRANWDTVLDKLPIKQTVDDSEVGGGERSAWVFGQDLLAELQSTAA